MARIALSLCTPTGARSARRRFACGIGLNASSCGAIPVGPATLVGFTTAIGYTKAIEFSPLYECTTAVKRTTAIEFSTLYECATALKRTTAA